MKICEKHHTFEAIG